MRSVRLAVAILAAAGACHLRAAGITGAQTCPSSGTLVTLIGFNSNAIPGCTINGLTYSGFSWTPGITNTTTVTPEQVTYTADDTSGLLNFFSTQFNISGSNVLFYTLQYIVDPPPIIIRAFDENLFDDPPVFPGTASIPTTICLGFAFVSNTCAGSTVSLLTFDNGGPTQVHDVVSFTPQSLVGISTVIDLEAHGASSEIGGFGNQVNPAPEPSSYLLAGVGLAVLLRNRARLASISLRKSD
jgi:hypothetical protein